MIVWVGYGNWREFVGEMVVGWIYCVVVVVLEILIGVLLVFHIYLIRIGMTTFNYLHSKSMKIIPENRKIAN